MKSLRTIALLSLALCTLATKAVSFEGRIDMRMTEGKKSSNIVYYYKGDKMRMESSESGEMGAMVFDAKSKEMLMLMPSQKMYMVMNAGGAPEPKSQKKVDPPVKTGRTEKILGYDCDEYTYTEGRNVTQFWVAKGLGAFRSMMQGGPGGKPQGQSEWETAFAEGGLFPLRTIQLNAKGKEISRMEATAVDTGSQSDSLFVAPKGYQKFEMPNMGSMMGR